MDKINIVILLLCVKIQMLCAQPNENSISTVELLCQQLSKYRQGYYDCCAMSKAHLSNDTNRICGRVYFFHQQESLDNIAHFAVFAEGYGRGYDGELFYYFNQLEKTVVYRLPKNRDVISLTSRNVIGDLIFWPVLSNDIVSSHLLLNQFFNASKDTIRNNDVLILRYTLLDSFPNPLKINAGDKDMQLWKWEYDINIADGTLLTLRRWVWCFPEPSYFEQIFSPITPLPDTVSFHSLLCFDSLKASGYTFRSLDQNPDTTNRNLALALHDTLPGFSLPALAGGFVRSDTITKGLILLDFWYKSCGPCLMSHPAIGRLYRRYGHRGLHVFGINGMDANDPEDLKRFTAARKIYNPVLLDTDKAYIKRLNVTGFPTFILADAHSGRVLFIQQGVPEDLEARLANAIELHINN